MKEVCYLKGETLIKLRKWSGEMGKLHGTGVKKIFRNDFGAILVLKSVICYKNIPGLERRNTHNVVYFHIRWSYCIINDDFPVCSV